MARQPRFIAEKLRHLIAQEAIHDVPLFHQLDDFVNFLELLKISAKVNSVAIHAYALLPRRILLLATPSTSDGLSKLMQWIGRRYIPAYNARHHRSGPLWKGRFRAAVLEDESFFLPVSRYVDQAPIREAVCEDPSIYPWSSCAAHVGSAPRGLLTDHPQYWQLGNTPFEREAAYRLLAEQALTSIEISRIETALVSGWALGSPAFLARLEKLAGRRLAAGKRGRPPSVRASTSEAK